MIIIITIIISIIIVLIIMVIIRIMIIITINLTRELLCRRLGANCSSGVGAPGRLILKWVVFQTCVIPESEDISSQ